jgi:hypothetical protein
LSNKIKVYVAIPTTSSIIDSQVYVLRDIEKLYSDKIEFVYPTNCVRRMFHDFARNKFVEDFLASDCDILWFLDSDITPPKHVLDLIVVHGAKWKVAGLTYPVFMKPPTSDILEVVYTAYEKNAATGNMALASVPKEGIKELDGLATGCLFIHREVLEKLERPYFEFTYNEVDRSIKEGEDLGFCRKVSALGYKFFTDFSMTCRHQKNVDLMDVNNYAIQYSNRNVTAYSDHIKEQVRDALQASYTKGVQDGLRKAAEKKKSAIWTPGDKV